MSTLVREKSHTRMGWKNPYRAEFLRQAIANQNVEPPAPVKRVAEVVKISRPIPRTPFGQVLYEIEEMYGFGRKEILGTGRRKTLTQARYHAFALYQERTGASLCAIGRRFKRDHSTVLHGIRKHKQRTEARS